MDSHCVICGRYLPEGEGMVCPICEKPKKAIHLICLEGCDDETEFEMECTDEEFAFLLRVASKANKTSTYGCMPRMLVDGEKVAEDGKRN